MPLSWMVQTAPKASPNLAQTLLGHKGLEMSAEGALLRAVALGTQVFAAGVSRLSRWGFSRALTSSSANPLWFLSDGRAAVREAVLGPEAPCPWRRRAARRREEEAGMWHRSGDCPLLSWPRDPAPPVALGWQLLLLLRNRVGQQPQAPSSTHSKASLKLFGHSACGTLNGFF